MIAIGPRENETSIHKMIIVQPKTTHFVSWQLSFSLKTLMRVGTMSSSIKAEIADIPNNWNKQEGKLNIYTSEKIVKLCQTLKIVLQLFLRWNLRPEQLFPCRRRPTQRQIGEISGRTYAQQKYTK